MKIIAIILAFLLLAGAGAAQTPPSPQCNPDTGVCLLAPSIFGQGTTKITGLGQYLAKLFPILVGLIGLVAIIRLVEQGVRYAMSGIPGVKGDAKEQIILVVKGLLLALGAYLIIKQINPTLLDLNFELK